MWTAPSFLTGLTLALGLYALIDVTLVWTILTALAPIFVLVEFHRFRAQRLGGYEAAG